jgi:hypothetical protein
MTNEEFKKMERICKDGWEWLARTGSSDKLRVFEGFVCLCPACHIADHVANDVDHNCKYCPVDKWSKIANDEDDNPTYLGFDAVCQRKGNEFHCWLNSQSDGARKKWAKKIANLPWEWTDEYADITIPAELLEGRS